MKILYYYQAKKGLPFSLNHLQGIFFIWMFGLTLASIVYMLEHIHYRWKQ